VDDVAADDPAAEAWLDELEQLVRDRVFDAMFHQIRARYPDLGTGQVEDAVADAIEGVLRRLQRGPTTGDLRSYLFKSAWNAARKAAGKAARRNETALADDEETPADAWRNATTSAEETALRNMAVQLLTAEVRCWENANIREVTLIYLEAAVAMEPIEATEVAERVGPILGEEINLTSVRQWKARGFRRLREYYLRLVESETELTPRKGEA
jgi:DNA-directed RNA polymerase specialized sigma24 family protein